MADKDNPDAKPDTKDAKSTPAAKRTPAAKKTGATKAGGKGSAAVANARKAGGSRPAGRPGGNPKKGGRKPPPIAVSQPKPWGLIAAAVVVVVFAASVIGYSVYRVQNRGPVSAADKAAAAAKIQGISTVNYEGGVHKETPIAYPQSPPIGGEHDPTWADCTGTVYPNPIRSENAVHSLEHGAIWITYQPGLSEDEVKTLADKVDGNQYMLMSPYPGLKTKVSLQSWGHQLFVDSADDKRIDEFIDYLRLNNNTAPEVGASCTNPDFAAAPRTPDATPSATASAPATSAPAGTATSSPAANG